MNHRVHVFISGCLTLKFSGSWNTVRISLSIVVLLDDDLSWLSLELPTGEMGIVSSGTCWSAFDALATSAIVTDWGEGKYGKVIEPQAALQATAETLVAKRGACWEVGWGEGGVVAVAPGDGFKGSSRETFLPVLLY